MTPFYRGPLLALDTETTGVSPFNDRIVTCSMVYDDEVNPPQIRNWIIDPGIEIPAGASDVHGVTTEMAREHGVSPEEGLRSIAHSLAPMMEGGIPLVIYNATFDLTLIRSEFARFGIDFDRDFDRVIDPLVIDKAMDRFRRGKRTLGVTASLYGYDLENAHNAEADCLAALSITRGMGSAYAMEQTIDEIHEAQKVWKHEQATSFQEYLRRTKEPDAVISTEWPYQTVDVSVSV